MRGSYDSVGSLDSMQFSAGVDVEGYCTVRVGLWDVVHIVGEGERSKIPFRHTHKKY